MTSLHRFRTLVRHWGRSVVYGTPLHRVAARVRGLAGQVPAHRSPAYWDERLAGRFKTYLGGTISIDVRNAITAQIMRRVAPDARSLLDVGCAGATLGPVVRQIGVERYVGVDISRVAIDSADPAVGELHVSDLCSFDPARGGPFDVIVFNEVLYYVDVDEAVAQVQRYASNLSPGGVLLVSLKHDAKTEPILDRFLARFEWLTGILFQEHQDRGRFAVRISAETPAYMVSAWRAGSGGNRRTSG